MKKSLIALALVGAFAAPAMAQTAAPAAAEEAKSAHTFTANVGVFSDYRFRGITQTKSRPAIQGGFDYSHESGFYIGNWNSNVDESAGFPDGNIEMDIYGGYKTAFGDFGLDVGAITYWYPGSSFSGGRNNGEMVTNKEVYLGGSWKFISAKAYYSIDDYFSATGLDNTNTFTGKSTKGTMYFDLSANYDLGDGWGVNGHVGYLDFKNVHNGDYTDWKLGVTKDVNGWVFGLSYVGTNAKGDQDSTGTNYQPYRFLKPGSQYTYDAGKSTFVASISRTF